MCIRDRFWVMESARCLGSQGKTKSIVKWNRIYEVSVMTNASFGLYLCSPQYLSIQPKPCVDLKSTWKCTTGDGANSFL